MKRGFTLLEVNLAIFILATGMLTMCALYSLGLRESRQSVEDVASAAFADAYLGPLVQGLAATNMTWSKWIDIGERANDESLPAWPTKGWAEYVDKPKETDGAKGFDFRVKDNPRAAADRVFGQLIGQLPSSTYKGTNPGIPSDYQYALVATRNGTVIQLAFRITRRKDSLLAQPLFVSEVRFQGDPEK